MAEKSFRPTLTYADEFQHAVNDQYKRIVDYFKPKFLLGLTATPERMDGRSIYEICDYNVPYEISLRDAINRGALVPFHYYGIYDNIVDYSKIRIIKGKYDEKELNKSYIGNVHRHELIYKNYKKFGSQKALGFCCSREHAEEMAKEFLEEHNELTLPEQQFCRTIGREFIELIETTSMSKVYKMPVLKAFYNNGNCLMKVNEDQLLKSWKEYFAIGANWRDLPQITSYQQYKNMLDKDHVNNIYKNPVKFLAQSGKGFFIINEDRTVSLKKELDKVVNNPIFAEQFGDVIEYRTMDYYSRRLAKDNDDIM